MNQYYAGDDSRGPIWQLYLCVLSPRGNTEKTLRVVSLYGLCGDSFRCKDSAGFMSSM